jgi:hypothetical protein
MDHKMWIPLAAAGVSLLIAVFTEWLHARRVKRLAVLSFGPAGKPRAWTAAAPWVRIVCLSGIAWCLSALLLLSASSVRGGDKEQGTQGSSAEQLVLLVDVSPSMLIVDAGAKGDQMRRDRVGDVVSSVLDRMGRQVRYTVICFYTRSLAIAKMAKDKSIVRNVFNGLPVEIIMKPGKTDLGLAVKDTLEFISDYPQGSVTLMVCSDGDTDSAPDMVETPDSIANALVLGVGSVKHGTPIDGHLSRQDSITLNRLSQQLHGSYLDVNKKQVPSAAIADLCDSGSLAASSKIGQVRLYTIWLAFFAAVYSFLPVALEFAGSDWKVVSRGSECPV